MTNILVTGGFGFLAQHLVSALLKKSPDFMITILDKVQGEFFLDELKGNGRIKIVTHADVTKPETMEAYFNGIHVVYHLAALVSFWRKHKSLLYKVNIEGTENVIKICIKHNIRRMVYVSSTAALGYNNDKENYADENWQYDWSKAGTFFYMLSKYYAEQRVRDACCDGFQAIIANPSSMFGPGDKKFYPLADNIATGKVPLMPGGFAVTDVRDTASGLVAMYDKGRSGEGYLLIGGNYTYKEIFNTIAEEQNAPLPSRMIPRIAAPLIVPLLGFFEILSPKEPKLMKEVVAPGFKYRYYNNSKAKKELEWKPQYSLKQSVRDALAYKASQQGGL
ncbi:MAG: NAD-dependent epimerase/dehydratase family protein [Spirochaetales bacterium]|nr:NAD-dependent epimerase/dehydratase family protein [Spirochaetales bacterium]